MAANISLARTFVITAFLTAPSVALAGQPVELTNNQLDRVTAGAATVAGAVDAQALGVLALTRTNANSFALQGPSPYPGQPSLGTTAAETSGTATAVGTNLAAQNQPPPSSGTSVVTNGAANGNVMTNSTFNQTSLGVGGVTFQSGFTFVYGAWVFGL